MRQRKILLLLGVVVAILMMSVGYAAIQQVNITVTGNAVVSPDQGNFKVAFVGTPTYSGKGTAILAITGDRTATINANGLTAKGDKLTAVFAVANTSIDITAYLAGSVTNVNTEYFKVTSTLDSAILEPQTGVTNLNVTVELIKTLISGNQTDSVTVELIASPTSIAGGGNIGVGPESDYTPQDVFVWASDDPNDSEYGKIIGYTSNIDNYPSLTVPTRCTKIEMTYLENIDEDTRRAMRRYTGNIKEIELPYTVIEIGEGAFSDYEFHNLEKINIPSSVMKIGDWAFAKCQSLTSIYLPGSVTSIGKGAFDQCHSLAWINIPNGITSISDWCFRVCSSLTTITIPNSVTNIGESAFTGCTSLTSINFDGTKEEWENITKGEDWNHGVPATYVQCTDGKVSLIEDTSDELFIWASEDPSNLGYGTIIGYTENIQNYTTLVIPDRCTKIEIDTSILSGDTDRTMRGYTNNIKEIELPSTITEIGSKAFGEYHFSSLKKINIPSSVTSIGENVFYCCGSLTTINYDGSVEQWKLIEKSVWWNYGAVINYVQCTDGRVSLVFDEYVIGDSVTVNGEEFYVIKNSSSTEEIVTLFAKSNIHPAYLEQRL